MLPISGEFVYAFEQAYDTIILGVLCLPGRQAAHSH